MISMGNNCVLATKEDIRSLQEGYSKLQTDMEKRFNQLTIWIVGKSFALGGIIIAILKL